MEKKKSQKFSLLNIFITVFFFSISAVLLLKPHLKVAVHLPHKAVYKKMSHKTLTGHVHIGKTVDSLYDGQEKIQINDAFIPIKDLQEAVKVLNKTRPKHLPAKGTTTISVEEGAKKKAVEQVRRALQLNTF